MKGCRKGFKAMEIDHHPDRLKKPLIRIEGVKKTFSSVEDSRNQFREASWEEALNLAAANLKQFKSEQGCSALLNLSSGGACRGHVHNNGNLTNRFLSLWGGATRTEGSYSSAAASFASPYVFGTKQAGMDAGNLHNSQLIILWGYNAFDTRFGCEYPLRIKEAKKRGVPVIVIDPRRTRTAELMGTKWIPVKPGTDVALMAAILYYLIQNNLTNRNYIEKYTSGFEDLADYVSGNTDGIAKTPEWASKLCGIKTSVITELAHLYGTTTPCALLPGLSMQRALAGEEAARMPMALQAATGNTGIPGGSSGGMFWGKLPEPYCPSIQAPKIQTNPSFPVYEWPDRILNDKKIKAVYITGGNLLAQGSDIQKNIHAFQKLDLAIGHDLFLTPTMAMCDIVFPIASFLEREDIVTPAGNFLLYSAKAANPPEGVLTDYQIFSELADRLKFKAEYTEDKTAAEWVQSLLERSEIRNIDIFKKSGIFMGERQDRSGLEEFITGPEKNPLATPSGKIEISSVAYEKLGYLPYPHYRAQMPVDKKYPLNLVTPHPLQGIHSQYANIEGFRMKEDRELWMNPEDARIRGITKENQVSISSPEGAMEVSVRITEDIMSGTVSFNEGLWPVLKKKNGSTIESAGSINMVTSTEPSLPARAARTHTVFVEVSAMF